MTKVDLSNFDNSSYRPGRLLLVRTIWYLLNVIFLKNYLNPFSGLKVFILRLFSATIGRRVVIKPGTNIKYPWNIVIGDHVWVGEKVWLDSLEKITIGSNVCISQGAYLCTGNHDYTKEKFDLIVKQIVIEDGVWVGAKAIICPGVTLRSHSVVTAGSIVTHDTEPYTIYQGNPAKPVRRRNIT
jgi:putative colanic acid biosynthesis acetyltransferase WcaF